jgi:hypothetical protein
MTSSNISASGEIEDLLNYGFTDNDAFCELIDNSLDARAKRIRIRFDSTTKTCCVDDDAAGMDTLALTRAPWHPHAPPPEHSGRWRVHPSDLQQQD